MSKIINEQNQLWHERDGENIKFGFTRNFLDQLDECWHILPANRTNIKAKAPLLTVETNDSLVSILAPIGGNFLTWNETASNFPDKLTENDVILTLTTARVAQAPAETEVDAAMRMLRERHVRMEADMRIRGANAVGRVPPRATVAQQWNTVAFDDFAPVEAQPTAPRRF